jgi:hypothetical protein
MAKNIDLVWRHNPDSNENGENDQLAGAPSRCGYDRQCPSAHFSGRDKGLVDVDRIRRAADRSPYVGDHRASRY